MNLWLWHGCLAFVAWGILAPIGTIAVTFRRTIFGDELWDRRDNPDDLTSSKWVKIHRYLHETVTLFTWILFGIAVSHVKKRHHFRNAHQVVGLVIFLSTFPLWILGRVLMPPKVPRNGNAAASEQSRLIPTGESRPHHEGPTRRETVLQWAHRILGGGILAAGLWEIDSSLSIYSKWQGHRDRYVLAYYIWCGLIAFCVFVFTVKTLAQRNT